MRSILRRDRQALSVLRPLHVHPLPVRSSIRTLATAAPVPSPSPSQSPLRKRDDLAFPAPSARPDQVPALIRIFPIFVVVSTFATLCFFNDQKASSSVVASTLNALRASETARETLGDDVDFAQSIPWIRGELSPDKGRIDISYRVKGGKAEGKMRFRSRQYEKKGPFKTSEWSIEMDDGTMIHLLEAEGPEPFDLSELMATP